MWQEKITPCDMNSFDPCDAKFVPKPLWHKVFPPCDMVCKWGGGPIFCRTPCDTIEFTLVTFLNCADPSWPVTITPCDMHSFAPCEKKCNCTPLWLESFALVTWYVYGVEDPFFYRTPCDTIEFTLVTFLNCDYPLWQVKATPCDINSLAPCDKKCHCTILWLSDYSLVTSRTLCDTIKFTLVTITPLLNTFTECECKCKLFIQRLLASLI